MFAQYIIVYKKVTVKNTDYQDLNRKSEIIVTAVPLKHTTVTRRTVTRVALGTML